MKDWMLRLFVLLVLAASGFDASAFAYNAGCDTWSHSTAPLPPAVAKQYRPLGFWMTPDTLEDVLMTVDSAEFAVDWDGPKPPISAVVVNGNSYSVNGNGNIKVPAVQIYQNFAFFDLGLMPAKEGEGTVRITAKKIRGTSMNLKTGLTTKFETGDNKTPELNETCTTLHVLAAGLQADMTVMTTAPGTRGPLAKARLFTEAGNSIHIRGLIEYVSPTEWPAGCQFDDISYEVGGTAYSSEQMRNVNFLVSPGRSVEVTVIGRPTPSAPGACAGPNYIVNFGEVIFTVDGSKNPQQRYNTRDVIWVPGNRRCASPVLDCSNGVGGITG